MSKYEKLQKFLWARYGNEGLDLCAGTVKLWMTRLLGIETSDTKGLQAAIELMKSEGRIFVHGSRTEVVNPYEGTVDWGRYAEDTIKEYEETLKMAKTLSG
jgi:hypothetical protein